LGQENVKNREFLDLLGGKDIKQGREGEDIYNVQPGTKTIKVAV
jgi:hypothetical protein